MQHQGIFNKIVLFCFVSLLLVAFYILWHIDSRKLRLFLLLGLGLTLSVQGGVIVNRVEETSRSIDELNFMVFELVYFLLMLFVVRSVLMAKEKFLKSVSKKIVKTDPSAEQWRLSGANMPDIETFEEPYRLARAKKVEADRKIAKIAVANDLDDEFYLIDPAEQAQHTRRPMPSGSAKSKIRTVTN